MTDRPVPALVYAPRPILHAYWFACWAAYQVCRVYPFNWPGFLWLISHAGVYIHSESVEEWVSSWREGRP
jgi:hypothetical protein